MPDDRTLRLHRVLAAPPERVYRAFLDPAALAKWLPPNGFTCTVDALDARVGGRYRMRFDNFSTGNGHASAASTSNWCPASGSCTPTASKTRACPAR